MNKPLRRIVDTLSADFFRSLEEGIVASFGQAVKVANEQYEVPERKAMIAQNRHAFCESGFRRVATSHGLEVHAWDTNPKGGVFSWAGKDGLFVLRGNIQSHCGTPRPTKFRREYAAFNEWLSPLQFDLLKDVPEPRDDRLCAMLVVSAPKHGYRDPSVPAFVGIGVPSSDLSTWKVLRPISEILAIYHDMEASSPQPVPVEIKGRVIPVLKKRTDSDKS